MNINNSKNWTIIGAPLSRKDESNGVELGPDSLRNAGLIEVMKNCDISAEDSGDLNFDINLLTSNIKKEDIDTNIYYTNVKNDEFFGKSCELLYNAAYEKHKQNKKVLVLGGDHSIATGSIAASLSMYPNLLVIWVDAHSDINTPDISFSGHYHGMPVGHLTGLFKKKLRGFEWLQNVPKLNFNSIGYIGLRDIDYEEDCILRNNNITNFDMHEIDKYGIGKIMEKILKILDPEDNRPIHLSFDIDSCDPSIAPGTGTKVDGGLNFRESRFICETLSKTNRLVSMDFVEVNPLIDTPCCSVVRQRIPINPNASTTVRLSLELISSALGKTFISLIL